MNSSRENTYKQFIHFQASGTIAAMNLKSGINILPSSCYTCYKILATLIPMWVGRASVSIEFKNCHFVPLWWLTARERRLAIACNVGPVKQKA